MKNIKIIIIFNFALCIFNFSLARADDILYTKTGEEYPGTLKQITPQAVIFMTGKGAVKFARDQVSSIDFSQRRTGDTWRKLGDITDPLLKELIATSPSDKDYPASNYLTPSIEWDLTVKPDSSVEKIYRAVRKVFTEPGKDVANTGAYYDSHYETARLDFGRGVTPDGRITHIRDAAIEDISVHPSPAQYDRLHELKIALPEAQIGSVLDYQTTITGKKFDDTNPFYADVGFGDDEPILVYTVRITVPKTWGLNYWAKDVGEPVKVESGDAKTYTWRVTKTPPVLYETNRPPRAELVPRLVVGLKADWNELARRYETVLKDSLNAPAMVKILSDSLIGGLTGEDERVTALYNFVAKNIRFIPVAMDEYAVVPHSIATILGQRVGNNLDKSFLLYGLLRQIGVSAALVLVPSRNKGPLVTEVPSLGQFDQALVAVNDTVLLEPATDRIPAGVLTGEVQGVSGLVIGSGKIVKTPLAPAAAEGNVLETFARLDEVGNLDANTTLKFSGTEAMAWRDYKEQSKAQTEVALNQFVTGIHPQAQLVDYKFSDLGDLSAPVRLEVHYRIPGYALQAGKFLLFTLPGVQYSAWEVGKPERLYPLSFNRLSLINHKLTIEYPWSFGVYALPDGANCTSAAIGYNSVFRVYHNQILFEDYLERDAVTIPKENYKDYQQAIETAASQSLGMIVLRKKG